MTLRELLDQATPGPWTPGAKWRTIQGATTQAVNDPDGNEVGHSWFTPEDARLIALAPELAALVLDMADALRALITEDSVVYDGGNTRDDVKALLARLDRISTQTEREGDIPGGEPVASGCETAGSIPATSNPPAPCVCVVPFRRRPLANPPVWSDGRVQATCDSNVHVFASVPGRCQCGSELWDGRYRVPGCVEGKA